MMNIYRGEDPFSITQMSFMNALKGKSNTRKHITNLSDKKIKHIHLPFSIKGMFSRYIKSSLTLP